MPTLQAWKGDAMAEKLRKTPLLDELEKGPWPSFVKEIKKSAAKNPMANDQLGMLERSYKDKIGHWKHGGLVGVMGYGGGVIGRYSDLPEEFPECAEFHTMRVNQPSGWFYTADVLRKLCDIWEKHGSGLTNMHGSTGDIILLGAKTEALEPVFSELTEIGFDLGGSGSDVRTPSCCCGEARCEWACYDTMKSHLRPHPALPGRAAPPGLPLQVQVQDGRLPQRLRGLGRPLGHVDHRHLAGRHPDRPGRGRRLRQERQVDIAEDVVDRCPTGCMKWDGKAFAIDNANCVKCMHCINVMPKALAPGKDRGATILLGAKAPIIGGALLSSVLVPFIEMDDPEDINELAEEIWDLWGEHGKNRERVGEFIQRIGLGNFLEQIGLDPEPEMVMHPRTNPYIFFELRRGGIDMSATPGYSQEDRHRSSALRTVPAPDHQEELRQVEVPRDPEAGRADARRRVRRQALLGARGHAAPDQHRDHPAVRRHRRRVLRRPPALHQPQQRRVPGRRREQDRSADRAPQEGRLPGRRHGRRRSPTSSTPRAGSTATRRPPTPRAWSSRSWTSSSRTSTAPRSCRPSCASPSPAA